MGDSSESMPTQAMEDATTPLFEAGSSDQAPDRRDPSLIRQLGQLFWESSVRAMCKLDEFHGTNFAKDFSRWTGKAYFVRD